ncbi:MAG: signal peptide peptidase SppA [Gammaproteobacteria bacterium]|nr:signal peptide peptidase SppA [Gammaproteobacteria bacterium]
MLAFSFLKSIEPMIFLRRFWDLISGIKNAIGNIFFLLVIMFLFFAIFPSERLPVGSGIALVINPKGSIVEQKSLVNPLDDLMSGNRTSEVVLRDVLVAISSAKSDEKIKVLVLDLSKLGDVAIGQLEEIGMALRDFKDSKKPIIAFGSAYSQTQYFIASFADQIILEKGALEPLGGVLFTGLGIYPLYYKALLDKLSLDFRVFTAGDYKDAVEPYLRNDMSILSKEGNQEWLNQLWATYKDTILKNRRMSSDDFDSYTNHYNQLLSKVADDPEDLSLEYELVDKVLSSSKWREEMIGLVGAAGNSFRHITYNQYLKTLRNSINMPGKTGNRIAVITASGPILGGNQSSGSVGSDSMTSLIERVRLDENVKALVFRINSPGGSASASEKIRRELELVQKEGKPVVVSMSGYATSGGYWISSTANKIFALESTVTGSIGVFMVFHTFGSALSQIGINGDGIGTTSLSGSMNQLKTMNPVLEDTLGRSVNRAYHRFISLVSEGRNMTLSEAEGVANGRVWAGKKALELGLVDAIGGLDDAISAAAVLSGVSDYQVIDVERELSTPERVASTLLQMTMATVDHMYGETSSLNIVVPRDFRHILSMSQSAALHSYCLYCRVY